MITITDKKNCNGCCACVDACPAQAIAMVTDAEGFWYPAVDRQKCLDCSRCDQVCPELHAKDKLLAVGQDPVCYAARHLNLETRLDSSSGGAFSAFAEAVFAEGGAVAGAVYDQDFNVRHVVAKHPVELGKLRISKYAQSSCQGLYQDIQAQLQDGKKLLVCGCPCQMAGLRLFLKKDYDHVILVDFICHGVNSPKVFRQHLDALEKKHGAKVVSVMARNKEHGWRKFTFKAVFENGDTIYNNGQNDPFIRGYLQTGYYSRPSCFDCQFKDIPRCADLTIGDFWGIENVAPSLDDDRGTSFIMCNTPKGTAFLDAVKDRLELRSVTLADIETGNRSMRHSIDTPQDRRQDFFADLDKMAFPKVAEKYFPKPATRKKWFKFGKNSLLRRLQTLVGCMGFSPKAWGQFLWLNFWRRNSTASFRNLHVIIPTKYCVFDIHPSAKIVVKGTVQFGFSKVRGSKMESRLRMDENTTLQFNDQMLLFADADIQIFPDGTLVFEGGPWSGVNIHCQITCADRIHIGRDTMLGRNVVLRDYDAHTIIQKGYKVKAPITIGDRCWIGEGAYVSKGVRIGDGAIVAARSWVMTKVKPRTLVAGSPAMPVSENVEWKV